MTFKDENDPAVKAALESETMTMTASKPPLQNKDAAEVTAPTAPTLLNDTHASSSTDGAGVKFTDIALPLIERGLRVHPVNPGQKRCTIAGWPDNATADIEQVKKWAAVMPDYNVAVVADPASACILDADAAGLLEQIERAAGTPCPPTFTVKSAGKGLPHVYFRPTDKSRALGNRSKTSLFDFKVQRSYVVGPGSTLNVDGEIRRYEVTCDAPLAPLPDAWADWIAANGVRDKAAPKGDLPKTHPDFDFEALLEHYDITVTNRRGDWYTTDPCPASGEHHGGNHETGIFYDGQSLGWNCFDTDCPGHTMTFGDVIRHLNQGDGLKLRTPYAGVIWSEKKEATGEKAQQQQLQFKYPKVPGKIREYVVLPIHKYDGWFPRGRVSMVGGSSGAGKTTLVVDLLDKQNRGEKFLGHPGAQVPFLLVFADRGELSNAETLERMGLLDRDLPIAHIPECLYGRQAVENILQKIEAHGLPAAVFVEGGDLLVEEPNKTPVVAAFMKDLQRIAAHYHVAIIISVGAPKSKPKDQHTLTRDRLFGSQAWGRMSETVATLSHVGNGTGDVRVLDVQHRQDASERFELQFCNGLLRERVSGADVYDPVTLWASAQPDWFTRADAVKAMKEADAGLGRTQVYEHLRKLIAEGKLETGTGEKGVATLRWKRTPVSEEEAAEFAKAF